MIPKWTKASNVLFYRNFIIFYNSLAMQIFEGLIQPVLYLFCFGYLLGSWFDITEISSYSSFVFIGILCSLAMSISCYESCYANVSFLSYKKLRPLLNILPINYNDIYVSSCLWAVFKSMVIMGLFLLIGAALGLISIYHFLAVIVLGLMLSFFFSSLTLFIATLSHWKKEDVPKILYLLIPLFLFSGTFFPADIYPVVAKELALYNPLGFSIASLRSSTLHQWSWYEFSMICTFLFLSFLFLMLSLHYRRGSLHKSQY